MATMISKEEEHGFDIHPAGLFQAVCLFVEDIGLQKTAGFQGKPDKIQRKLIIVWESEEKQADGTPFILRKKYTASFFREARLLKDLEAWRGRKFTETELAGFDVDTVIGANCFLNIVHQENEGKSYANISGVIQLKAGTPKMTATIKAMPDWLSKSLSDLRAKAVTVGEAKEHASNPPMPEDDLPF